MRQWLFGISVLCLSLSSAIQTVSAQTPPAVKGATIELAQASSQDAKQAIVQLYQSMDDALNQRDMQRLGSFMAPEYTVTGLDKTVKNRQQFLQMSVENLQVLQQLKTQTQLKQIKIDGKMATVTGVTTFRGMLTDPNNAQASGGVMGEQSFQDVLQLVGPEWKLVTTVTRSEKTQVEPLPNPPTKTSNHDTMQAFSLGMSAIHGCYDESRLEDCEKLNRMRSTLSTWCSTDSEACRVWSSLESIVAAAITANLAKH
jgi:ketosteroid isomerase-like protein